MLSLSQTTGYAILALGCLDSSGNQPVLAKQIAGCSGIPLPYLSKVLHALTRSDLIVSKRGYKGGFTLARPAQEISLADVAQAVEGPDWLPDCLLGLAGCESRVACPTHDFWQAQRERIRAELKRVTLAQVSPHTLDCCHDTCAIMSAEVEPCQEVQTT